MPRLVLGAEGWTLAVRGDEDEAEASARAALDEVLEPEGPAAGTLDVEFEGSRVVLSVLRDEKQAALRMERAAAAGKEGPPGLVLRGHRTALKAWLELWGLTGEGAGDYYLELIDATRPGEAPTATDLRLHRIE